MACLARLFDWLCGLVRPSGSGDDHPDVRSLGLLLINALLEHRGKSLQRFPSLLLHIQDEVCHCLLQTLLGAPLTVLTLALRVLFNLYSAMKQHLKTQLELLLRTLIEVASRSDTVYEHQEVILEALAEFCRLPSFAVDIYVNYDCDMHCTDLFQTMAKFFYKHAFPTTGALHTIHLLSLDCLLSFLAGVATRIDTVGLTASVTNQATSTLPSAAQLREGEKSVKRNRLKRNQFLSHPISLSHSLSLHSWSCQSVAFARLRTIQCRHEEWRRVFGQQRAGGEQRRRRNAVDRVVGAVFPLGAWSRRVRCWR